jgi:hypothetical protein
MPKNFYIIGHNPNTIEEAKEFLDNGANAIEPDVCYHPDKPEKFYVHEDIDQIPDFIENFFRTEFISLKEYLTDLRKLLTENPHYDLKLIDFDLKPEYAYDINELYSVIRENFSDHFPGIKILTTVSTPEAMPFLANMKSQKSNEAIGVDEHCEPEEVYNFFKDKQLKYTFAAGSAFFSPGREKFVERIKRALHMCGENGFRFVHAWCINDEEHMRIYLDMHTPINAILTDDAKKLRDLVTSPEYAERYTLDFEAGDF